MERKFFIGISLLAGMLIGCLWLSAAFSRQQAAIVDNVEQAITAVQNGDLSTGSSRIRQAKDGWERYWKRTASFSHHAPMEEIDSLFSQLQVCTTDESIPDFLSCSAQLRSRLKAITEDHIFRWWNLL